MTRGPVVGSVRSHFLDDLYEQCSFHIAEKMPSSVRVGWRPISSMIFLYSSDLSPWSEMSLGVISGVLSKAMESARVEGGSVRAS